MARLTVDLFEAATAGEEGIVAALDARLAATAQMLEAAVDNVIASGDG